MKRFFVLCMMIGSMCLYTIAQGEDSDSTVITFENFELPVDTFLNGSDLSGGFASGAVFLPNTYTITPDFESWSGWAISTETDTVTPGFLNQYSASTGGGMDSSLAYAVTFASGGSIMKFADTAQYVVQGMHITNNTYAYLSMLEGDDFAKRFGGESGDDPDFFLLTIKAYVDGELSTDSVDFYLADFRFEDNSQDYIVNTWEYLDLSRLGMVDSLLFTLSSSDVGQFGMNTPAYFCVDNVILNQIFTAAKELQTPISMNVYPNPVINELHIESGATRAYAGNILSLEGKVIESFDLLPGHNFFNVSDYPSGTYVVMIPADSEHLVWKFVKQ